MIRCHVYHANISFFATYAKWGKRRQLKHYYNTQCEAITAIHNVKGNDEKSVEVIGEGMP
jgi:hypothetical protein